MKTVISATSGKPICMLCVLEQMRRMGGSFVKKLGEIWWHADATDRRLIETTWANCFMEYADHAERVNRCVHKCD